MEESKEISRLELFYDVFDESNNVLYEITKENYFDLIIMTANNILAGEVLNDVSESDSNKLLKIYEKLENIDFNVEDVRKAIQSILLRGFRETRLSNGGTTPDTLGIFTSYLISRFERNKVGDLNILDPLIGTGNYLFTVANHLDRNLNLFGVDHNEKMTSVCKVFADLLSLPVEIYLQDTFSIGLKNMDYIIFDMPNAIKENDVYFPYEAIIHYVSFLKDEGVMIGIVANDFFDYDQDHKFKDEISNEMTILAVFELPENMFISNPKSIIVLKKKKLDLKKLTIKLPSFTNVNEFNNSLMKIENWFQNI